LAFTRDCGALVSRLPSLTGSDAELLDEYLPPLPSREKATELVLEALDEMSASPEPVLLLVVAEWGEGKTSIYNAKVKPLAEARGWRLLEARAATVAAYLRSIPEDREKGAALRLLASLLAAGLEQAGLIGEYGPPASYGSLLEYVERVYSRLAAGSKLVVFVDELEDLVAGAREEELAELVAGLLGIVNGDVALFTTRCARSGGRRCWPGGLHLVVSLTPPAYSRLMGIRDFATIAARLKRRVRTVWIKPLSRREALAFLESLARYSTGGGLDGILRDHGLGHALVASSLGNMGALVSSFRYVAAWARGRRGCGERVARLSPRELLEALSGLVISVGGTEVPALNLDAYNRLREGVEARAKLSGLPPQKALGLLDELIARGASSIRVLEEATGLRESVLKAVIDEINLYAEEGWLRSELGVRRLVYAVGLTPAVEDAFKLLRSVEPEALKLLPQLAQGRAGASALEEILDSLVYSDPRGRQVAAVPLTPSDTVDLVADASPVELGRSEAERLASLLWEAVFSKLQQDVEEEGLLLSPRVQRLVYISPELSYLDFIADRFERLQVIRRIYSGGGRQHLLLGAVAVLAAAGLLAEPPSPHGDGAARLRLKMGHATARVMIVASLGEITEAVARRVESLATAALLTGWRPHAIVVVGHGGVEAAASRILEGLEKRLFTKTITVTVPSLVSRIKLQAIGLKLLDKAASLEEALAKAFTLSQREAAESLGFDPLRLWQTLSDLGGELSIAEKVAGALEEGVDGAPLVIRDPKLGYEVEKPTELAGALRYFLATPSTTATAREALEAAHEYVQRYHLYRGGGGEAKGLLSPDIERGEVAALEKYMLLLASNGFLEKRNGSVKIDVLSPMEKSVVKALEQLGAGRDEVPASRIWELLVVDARNPGTKKMILQSLAYRGLIEPSSRRIDPEKTRVRLRNTAADARKLIAEARSLVERLREDTTAFSWGLFASSKARGVRAGSLMGLTAKLNHLLSLAEDALKAGSTRMSLRLASTARELADYALTELLPRAREAAEEAARLRRMIEERLEEARELREAFAKLASKLLGAEIVLAGSVEERLRRGLEIIDTVARMEITEEELEERVKELWREARAKNPRRPGETLPFYIHGRGPLLKYNYKLWVLASRLEEENILVWASSGPQLSPLLEQWLARARRIVERLRGIVEENAEYRRRLQRLRERVERLGARLRAVPAPLPAAGGGGVLSIEEAEVFVEALENAVRDSVKPIEEAERELERFERVLENARSVREKALATVKTLGERAARLREAGLKALAEGLEEAAADLKTAVEQAVRQEERSLARLASADSLEALSLAAREAQGLAEAALVVVRDSLEQAERRLREAMGVVEQERRRLRIEAEALSKVLGDAAGELRWPGVLDPLEELVKLRDAIGSLREKCRSEGLLTETELRAYYVITAERSRRGELLLSEAAEAVAEELGLGVEEARRVIIRLIEKNIVEPRL